MLKDTSQRTALGVVAAIVLLTVATSPLWRTGFAWVHGISAGTFLLAYIGHLAFRGWQLGSLVISERQRG